MVGLPDAAATAAGPRVVVRNTAPQEAAHPESARQPIYYPHRLGGGAPEGEQMRLRREFLDLHTAMSYERAAEVAWLLIEAAPDAAEAHYNLACALGRLHRTDGALDALEQAVACGWTDLVHLSLDPDLDSVRATDRYTRLVGRLQVQEMDNPSPLLVIDGKPAGPPPANSSPVDRLAAAIAGALQQGQITGSPDEVGETLVLLGERLGFEACPSGDQGAVRVDLTHRITGDSARLWWDARLNRGLIEQPAAPVEPEPAPPGASPTVTAVSASGSSGA